MLTTTLNVKDIGDIILSMVSDIPSLAELDDSTIVRKIIINFKYMGLIVIIGSGVVSLTDKGELYRDKLIIF